MAKSGGEFEKLAESIFKKLKENPNDKITRNAFLEGPDGKREIDILIESEIYGFTVRTIIECKDYNKKVDLTTFDGFISKKEDVNASKGIYITGKGFSKNVLHKAKRLGIECYTIHQANNEKRSIDFKIPVLCEKIDKITIALTVGGFAKSGKSVDPSIINGVDIRGYFIKNYKEKKYDKELFSGGEESTINLMEIADDGTFYVIDKVNGDRISAKHVSLTMKVDKVFGMLYLDTIKDTNIIKDLVRGNSKIIFDIGEVVNTLLGEKIKFYDSTNFFDKSEKINIGIRLAPEDIELYGDGILTRKQ